MKIKQLRIRNFRCIRSLDWKVDSSIACLLGPGDAGKSTILDAIEATLSHWWPPFTDGDFFNLDVSQEISIEVTVGSLSQAILSDRRFGLSLRGWSKEAGLVDEPNEQVEPVVTVRLRVDGSLDPVWEVVTDRSEPRVVSNRDRALFGVVRLGDDAERHLSWVQGSGLSRLTKETGSAVPLMTEAYRKARELLGSGNLSELTEVAERVRVGSKALGAYSGEKYTVGLDAQRASTRLGALTLHDEKVPLRQAGLGTRRLVALAVQRISIPEGAIVLIDEIEHGLEPHRIRYTIKSIRDAIDRGAGPDSMGQVILTTHSSVTVVELPVEHLRVVRQDANVSVIHTPAAELQNLVRQMPEALLSRRVLVSEGKTEVGLLRAFRVTWSKSHDGAPPEALGTVIADGNGKEAVTRATRLSTLGYKVALLRDSDVPLTPDEKTELAKGRVQVIEWPGNCSTEERVIADLDDEGVQALLDTAISFSDESLVLAQISTALGANIGGRDWSTWPSSALGKTKGDCRNAIASAAKSKAGSWFKRIEPGEELGKIIESRLQQIPGTALVKTLEEIETWIYA